MSPDTQTSWFHAAVVPAHSHSIRGPVFITQSCSAQDSHNFRGKDQGTGLAALDKSTSSQLRNQYASFEYRLLNSGSI